MNLVLLDDCTALADARVIVRGRAVTHVREVLGKGVGDELRVGLLGGAIGTARILALGPDAMELECALDQAPPPKRALELVVALPRPPVLRRVLQHATAMGVGRIVLCNAARVEKSYWTSAAVQPASIEAQLRLGLEQARDTVLPVVELRPRVRPFVQDELAPRGDVHKWVADAGATRVCPTDLGGASIVAVGPEGGWVPFELELWRAAGFTAVSLGARILRVETAVVALLARLGG